MFGSRIRSSWQRKNTHDRIRLCAELLEARDVPTIIFTDTFVWEDVTVAVTVDDAKPGFEGLYHWNFHLTNDSFDSFGQMFGPIPPGGGGVAAFALPVEDSTMVSNLGNSNGWSGSVGTFLGDPDLVAWEAGAQPTIKIEESADFWFTTTPTDLANTNGIIDGITGASLTDSPAGFLVVPILGQPTPEQGPPPTKIVVSSEKDQADPQRGLTTLREAIGAVNTPASVLSKVLFTDGMNDKTISLGNMASLSLGKAITISTTTVYGEARNITVTLAANAGAFSLFTVGQNIVATIEGLNLTGGGGEAPANVRGGAVYSQGDTALVNCKITFNEARYGGGVYSRGSSLQLSYCEVSRNNADAVNGAKGGGIYVETGSLQVENCLISKNQATTDGGGIALGAEALGANIVDSLIKENLTSESGGGIYLEGGTQAPTILWVIGTTISENKAAGNGGGIAVGEDRLADVTLTDVWIEGNKAGWNGVGNGGGVYLGSGTLMTNNAIVISNSANQGFGGGLYFALGTWWFDGRIMSVIAFNTPDQYAWES